MSALLLINHEILIAQSAPRRSACVHLSLHTLIPPHTHTQGLLIYFTAVLGCFFVLFFRPDPLIVIQRWRWRADGGDERICGEEKQRSFPQVKGVINSRAEGDSDKERSESVRTFVWQWKGRCERDRQSREVMSLPVTSYFSCEQKRG